MPVYNAIMQGVTEALYSSRYDMGAVVRRDEAEFLSSGTDTSLFVTGVTPTSYVKASPTDPDPTMGDLSGALPGNDAWLGAVPGATLSFDVSTDTTGFPALPVPQYFRVYIDIVADGVTVVDTMEVTIMVPAQ